MLTPRCKSRSQEKKEEVEKLKKDMSCLKKMSRRCQRESSGEREPNREGVRLD